MRGKPSIVTVHFLIITYVVLLAVILKHAYEPHMEAVSVNGIEEPVYGWERLKNHYAGQRVFVVGNGPSLNKTPLHLLHRDVSMSFNRFYLYSERILYFPQFYMCIDSVVCPDISEEITTLVMPNVTHAFFPLGHKETRYRDYLGDSSKHHWFSFDEVEGKSGFEDGNMLIATSGTVASAALEVLDHMGFSHVYLVGADMHYTRSDEDRGDRRGDRGDLYLEGEADADPDHFDPRYFGSGRKFKAPNVESVMLPSLKKACDILSSRGRTVINAGVGGSVDFLPRVNLRDLFPDVSPAEELLLALRDILPAPELQALQAHHQKGMANGGGRAGGRGGVEEYLSPRAVVVDITSDWSPELQLAVVAGAVADVVLRTALNSHVPFGPFWSGQYVFYRRPPPRAGGDWKHDGREEM